MYFEEIPLNASADTKKVRISKSDMQNFAKQYDPLPLHTDENYARQTRFGTIIAPGVMAFMSVWAKYIEDIDFCGSQLIAGKSTHIEWFLPVFENDVLYGRATVTAITPRNEYNGIVEITIDVYNQNGALVLRDVTEAVVERKPADR
ncbi:MAG: MaoC family dehydratase N-terminal domain-containing protein [Oscillospiraceae bacterium]|nr:MaoC family dehydratase N-terminal domain-containing protein [Oscillospiraceae bacterium]